MEDKELNDAEFKAMMDADIEQGVEEARGMATEVATYFTELVRGGVPPQLAATLTREWQQLEAQYRLNMDIRSAE